MSAAAPRPAYRATTPGGSAPTSVDGAPAAAPAALRPQAPAVLRALRPREPRVAAVVHRGDVSSLAWTAMHRDGHVVPLWGDCASTAGTPVDPTVRALALARLVPARGVVGRLAAVWVHTGTAAPAQVDVLVPSGGRRTDPHPLRRAAEAVLEDGDVDQLAGVAVTTVLRTGVDVARWVPAASAVPALRALVTVGLDPGLALVELGRFTGHRGVVQAEQLLRALP